jgi:hypothetical protein
VPSFGLEIVSQFAPDGFGAVYRLEKVEVIFVQLGNSGEMKPLELNMGI